MSGIGTADPVLLNGEPVAVAALVAMARGLHRAIVMFVIDLFTLVDGRITEVWAVSDELGLLSRLDAVRLTGDPAGAVDAPE